MSVATQSSEIVAHMANTARLTLVSTAPRPFVLARLWSEIATVPRKRMIADNFMENDTENSSGVSTTNLQSPQDFHSGGGPFSASLIPSRSRTSSVTTTTLVPQYESRSSWFSAVIPTREHSVSDAPPTYRSDSDSEFSL